LAFRELLSFWSVDCLGRLGYQWLVYRPLTSERGESEILAGVRMEFLESRVVSEDYSQQA
jgi:hypothetical protein